MSEFDPLLTAEAVGYREAKIVGILANDEHSGNTLFRDLNPALVDVSPLRYEEFCRCPPSAVPLFRKHSGNPVLPALI